MKLPANLEDSLVIKYARVKGFSGALAPIKKQYVFILSTSS
jgi:hypothetical protein